MLSSFSLLPDNLNFSLPRFSALDVPRQSHWITQMSNQSYLTQLAKRNILWPILKSFSLLPDRPYFWSLRFSASDTPPRSHWTTQRSAKSWWSSPMPPLKSSRASALGTNHTSGEQAPNRTNSGSMGENLLVRLWGAFGARALGRFKVFETQQRLSLLVSPSSKMSVAI